VKLRTGCEEAAAIPPGVAFEIGDDAASFGHE
jgi:hypothetical protein